MAPKELVENLVKYNRDVVHYTGGTIARPERHDGGLKPVVGVHSIQTMRGERPWTYNHQPMMAWWNGKFYMHYLTNPRHEHEPPGKTMLQTSDDGYTWSEPVELFPEYPVPDGFAKESLPGVTASDLKAVMHQRVGFYVAPNGKLIAIGNYGIALTPKDDPNDGNGIGRVVREVKCDGTFGPIYFVYYNHDFNDRNTLYPWYKRSKDKAFVKAVDALLADPMQRMQWVEEADRNDPLIPLNKAYKAFSGYTLPDGRKVALWKHAVTSLSIDGGNTWREPCDRAPGFVNANAKIWGQRLTDGTYATVYNPAEYRWPLAISLSSDGLEYTTLSLVHGDVTPLRHGGNYKSYGPQYTRGIQEGNGIPRDSDLWVTYSNNKEDMWVSHIPVPVRLNATTHAAPFNPDATLASLNDWNLHIPVLCPITLDEGRLTLHDSDPYDYAKAERVIPNTQELEVEFDLTFDQANHGELDVEFVDDGGNVASRIVADSTGVIRVKGGARYGTLLKRYEAGVTYHVKAMLSTSLHRAVYYVDGKKACERQFDTPVESISRIVFRTGPLFDKPDTDTPADQDFDMPRADERDPSATFHIANVVSRSLDGDAPAAVLRYADFAHYAERFNAMDDELTPTTIPNTQASEWMERNIPLFDCPDDDFREIYYFRWWTLRKHIKRTPAGFGMTEFLVDRSYADRYNLIACAIGHHVMESRWLRDTTYIHQILRTWYYGNDGQAMSKMNKFSSWNPYAVQQLFKVQGDTAFVLSLRPRLEEEYARWESTNRLPSGLYWQGDVQDGMEESISGGRKKQYARPTINSYMCGNAEALAWMNMLDYDVDKARLYKKKAGTLRNLIVTHLWNEEDKFFETRRGDVGDTLAAVREAIGFIPWYFNLTFTNPKYDVAWLQLLDEQGFSAPYGLTTAERRHPEFRSHGVGRCEWDGAIWPFATSQTLTALANYLNDYRTPHVVGDSVFFRQMELYVESQHHRGKPYIGEYLDETNGAWLMGDRERSCYYNHSTFNDLVITGIVGLRPQTDGSIVVNPLLPHDKWNFFCLDGIRYRGHDLTIIWDKDGQRYHQGSGLTILIDGIPRAHRPDLGKLTYLAP
ncbi:MAG: six-hairpin glycosidase [Prevotella sp.]|nr:six-hairpin glycosidase [Prevotella sp.]